MRGLFSGCCVLKDLVLVIKQKTASSLHCSHAVDLIGSNTVSKCLTQASSDPANLALILSFNEKLDERLLCTFNKCPRLLATVPQCDASLLKQPWSSPAFEF